MNYSTAICFIAGIFISVVMACNTNRPETKTVTGSPQQPLLQQNKVKQQAEQALKVVCLQRKDYSTTFGSFFDDTIIPQQAFTDLNNDCRIDFAWVVIKDHNVKIAVALSTGESYLYWLSPFDCEIKKTAGINTSVTALPAGRKDVMRPVEKSLELNNNGFLVQLLEQEKWIIYTNHTGEIQVFQL